MQDYSSKNPPNIQSGEPGSEAALQKLIDVVSRSQQSYRDLIDHLDQAVFTLSPGGEILVANRHLSEILGVPFSEFIGRSFVDFIDSPSLDQARKALLQLKDGASWSGTVSIKLKREKYPRHFACWFQPVVSKGELTGVIGWARDTSAEHEAEIRFADLFDSLREGMFFTTIEGRILDANPAFVRMLGYASKQELMAQNFRDLYVDPAVRDAIVRELQSNRPVEDHEVSMRHKSGKEIHCRASGFAIRDAAGRITHTQGTMIDVTERLEIERRLQQEQEFVRRLIASFPDVIAVFDCDARYTYISPRIEDVLGYPAREYLGEEVGWRADAEDRPALAASIRNLIRGEVQHVQMDFRVQRRDGIWRTMRASAGPLYDGNVISGVVASARDVTDSKHSEEQLAQTEKFAAMGQMLTGAAHELNNPLTAILGVGELLRDRAADDAGRRHADIVLRQAKRAAEIVQDLLAFSRPTAQGRAMLQLSDVVRQILDARRDDLSARNIELRFRAPDTLPPVEGDLKLLSQAFFNILTNAEQAIAAARHRGAIDVSLARTGDKIAVTFADDGPGISADDVHKIFDPFFTTKRPGGGSGLGLTIAMVVVREHGGTIDVQSQPGKGAAFRILLPAAVPDRSVESAPLKGARPADLFQGRAVLVVDDEESIREIVQEGLRARGLEVDCAESVAAALDLLARRAYDFVLCDFNLPGKRGTELFEQIRGTSSQPSHAFIFMTGDLVEPAITAEIRQRGAHILQKPFQVSALASLLTQLLQLQPVSR
ncbi:MAG TPA: PAS domain S-box protein [Candidatus Acidoferrales bacterium]|nr:PAS domain S-box protein [Candidatus Acidoferrales bacterium]